MPLEIRELIIRTQIVSDDHSNHTNNAFVKNELDTKLMVEQCVNQVLKVLKKQKDR